MIKCLKNIMFEFSHVFVDISKDECPFVDVLENSVVQIIIKMNLNVLVEFIYLKYKNKTMALYTNSW